MSDNHNATFHSFKASGKWYATGRGHLSEQIFKSIFDTQQRRFQIAQDNDMCYPGLSTAGNDFVFVVIPDEDHPNGIPLMLRPL